MCVCVYIGSYFIPTLCVPHKFGRTRIRPKIVIRKHCKHEDISESKALRENASAACFISVFTRFPFILHIGTHASITLHRNRKAVVVIKKILTRLNTRAKNTRYKILFLVYPQYMLCISSLKPGTSYITYLLYNLKHRL